MSWTYVHLVGIRTPLSKRQAGGEVEASCYVVGLLCRQVICQADPSQTPRNMSILHYYQLRWQKLGRFDLVAVFMKFFFVSFGRCSLICAANRKLPVRLYSNITHMIWLGWGNNAKALSKNYSERHHFYNGFYNYPMWVQCLCFREGQFLLPFTLSE